MYEWKQQIQMIIDSIDESIKNYDDKELTLSKLSNELGYSKYHTTRKFKEVSGVQFKAYLRQRKLAFALKALRDTDKKIIDIAFDYGFSSNEAFTRAFKQTYGLTPSQYRNDPKPLVLRTKITAFDRYLLGMDEIGMVISNEDIKVYFVTIPAHKYLYIENYESNGYWDFWSKQNLIAGQDYDTICGYLESIKGNLDDHGGNECNSGSGHIMAYINNPNGRLCEWGIPHTECYGIRLPFDYDGDIPLQMILSDIEEGDYIVFEHGPFDYNQENRTVEAKIEKAMSTFDFDSMNICYDTTPGRIIYLYYDPEHYLKYVRPIKTTP